MKITLSLAVLALTASQVMAVIPKPVAECTKSVIVVPTDSDGCDAFAKRNGVTFDDMLKWNTKLSPKCDNLDEGWPICISVTPGDCCMAKRGQNNTASTTVAGTTTGAQTTGPVATGTTTVALPSGVSTTGATTTTVKPTVSATPGPNSGAVSTKGSMVLAAAGVLLSAVYML
ncbi:hypothetical protein BGZ76_000410 [Entomortierella beljakovae]|nr:hypothetical protein BGZ76_000410 [Entomortierella beljakovae]